MQKQLMLFLSPVEMLIFNTLFENVLAPRGPAPKGERLISLTPAEFETLRQGIIEAKITRPAEEFVDDFIESMIDCGLLIRVNDKSEKPPIGELRPTVAKDEIAGPNYSVERGVFSVATPLKLKAMPTGQKTEPSAAEVPAPEIQDITRRLEELEQKVSGQGQLLAKCAELINIDFSEQPAEPKAETVKCEIDIMVKSQEFISFPIIDQFISLLLLSPFANSWATTPEFNDYIEKHGSKDLMTPKFKRLTTVYITNQQILFERKRISDIERQERGLLAPTRWLFRLTPEGESRARRVLKHWQEITGTKDKALIGSDAADARAPGSTDGGCLEKTTQILRCPRFRELSYIDMLLVFIGVSPFAEKWFTRPELGEFMEQCGKNHPLKRPRLDAYLDGYNRKAGGIFEQKNITRAEKLKKWYPAQTRVQYRLTALGKLRTRKLLEKFE